MRKQSACLLTISIIKQKLKNILKINKYPTKQFYPQNDYLAFLRLRVHV